MKTDPNPPGCYLTRTSSRFIILLTYPIKPRVVQSSPRAIVARLEVMSAQDPDLLGASLTASKVGVQQ
jgi:hypothetical protein